MTILNPEHLFEQAERLASPSTAGRPRQADLRRAVSSAYYGLFHFTLAALADEFVGASQRASKRYALVYRSVEHQALKALCLEIGKQTPSASYAAYLPSGGLGTDIEAFAKATVELQQKRHNADYNPLQNSRVSETVLTIETARSSIRFFQRADQEPRRLFLTLLLCPPRR